MLYDHSSMLWERNIFQSQVILIVHRISYLIWRQLHADNVCGTADNDDDVDGSYSMWSYATNIAAISTRRRLLRRCVDFIYHLSYYVPPSVRLHSQPRVRSTRIYIWHVHIEIETLGRFAREKKMSRDYFMAILFQMCSTKKKEKETNEEKAMDIIEHYMTRSFFLIIFFFNF